MNGCEDAPEGSIFITLSENKAGRLKLFKIWWCDLKGKVVVMVVQVV